MTDDNQSTRDVPVSTEGEQVTSLNMQEEPLQPNTTFAVPTDLADAGRDTTIPQADSPESLDQEIAEGADRGSIDPDHTTVRPAINNIDKEQNGAD
jgi:hypothetical protein